MKSCNRDKLHHKTERAALNHLAWARKQQRGKGLRDLNVYQCSCGGWCVGRALGGKKERQAMEERQEQMRPKQPTPGLLRPNAPNSPSPGVTVAFIVENGAPVEFLQFDKK